LRPGRLLGYDEPDLHLTDLEQKLAPGDLLVLFTDGLLEARAPDQGPQFGIERLHAAVQEIAPSLPLSKGAELIRKRLHQFTCTQELRDDVTLLLLRRNP
jgi:phosphoserine phosphatase RsbU/P